MTSNRYVIGCFVDEEIFNELHDFGNDKHLNHKLIIVLKFFFSGHQLCWNDSLPYATVAETWLGGIRRWFVAASCAGCSKLSLSDLYRWRCVVWIVAYRSHEQVEALRSICGHFMAALNLLPKRSMLSGEHSCRSVSQPAVVALLSNYCRRHRTVSSLFFGAALKRHPTTMYSYFFAAHRGNRRLHVSLHVHRFFRFLLRRRDVFTGDSMI